MKAVAFRPCSPFSINRQQKLRTPIFSVTDRPSEFSFRKDFLQLTISSVRSDGSKRSLSSQKSSAPRRTRKEDTSRVSDSADGKSSRSPKQEEMIALFRRIQSSISKEESGNTKKIDFDSSEGKPPVEFVLEAHPQSRKQVKADPMGTGEGYKGFTRTRGVLWKKDEVPDNESVSDFKLTRPPSNFMKRSPIPSPSIPRAKFLEQNSETSADTTSNEVSNLPRIETLKLVELKELAKLRGIKGYSRMRKTELIELLRP